jgi:hypothetical protein
MWIAVTAGIVISVTYGTILRKKKKFESYSMLFNFFIGLIAVFVGAYLSFYLNGVQVENQEKKDLLGHIDRTVPELNDEVAAMDLYYSELMAVDLDRAKQIMDDNYESDILSIYNLVNSPLLPKYFTPFGVRYTQGMYRQKEKFRNLVNDSGVSIEKRLDFIRFYRDHLQGIKLCLLIQKDYMLEKISANETDKRMETELPFIYEGEGIKLFWK